MTLSRIRVSAAVLAVAAPVLLAAPGRAAAPRLGPVVRVQTPGQAACHAESETAVAQTSAGTWVAYNDLGICQAADNTALGGHITYLQLLPAGGGAPKVIALPALGDRWGYAGDPALAPDVDGGGVVFATLTDIATPEVSGMSVSSATVRLEVLRVSPSGAVRRLPAASGSAPFDDREAAAADRDPTSPHYGWIYVAWDDAVVSQVTMRAFDGHRWMPRVLVNDAGGGRPDVAVGGGGRLAVAYETADGVQVKVARDPRRPLGPAVLALAGGDPGHVNPSCPLISSIGLRQRVIRSPRLAWDTNGRLHLVAAMGNGSLVPAPVAGDSVVTHAISADFGHAWVRSGLTEQTSWAPAITALPGGDVAIGYLELADAQGSTFTARVWRSRGGSLAVSPAPAALSEVTETQGSNYCYGMGDYTGIAARGSDVAYAWPSTAGAAAPAFDTDVLVRHVS